MGTNTNEYADELLGPIPGIQRVREVDSRNISEEIPRVDGPQEPSFNREEARNLAKESLDFLAALGMPETSIYKWPPIFQAAWQLLKEKVELQRDFTKIALGIPRGFAKTTFVKIFILFCILFTNRRFILIVSAGSGHAENIVSDVSDMLDEPNIQKIFGDWRINMKRDTQAVKLFNFLGRPIILAGLGEGGNLRGLNLKNSRPDVIIFEDFQSRDNAESDVLSDALLKHMLGTIMKMKSPTGCLYLFVANMYPTTGSILKKLKHSTQWISFIVGGLLADLTSVWEELQPAKQLLEELQNDTELGHPEIFYAEVLNDEDALVKAGIDINNIPICPLNLDDPPDGAAIIIDPATGKTGGDKVGIGLMYVYDNVPVAVRCIHDKLTPLQTIQEAIKLAQANNTRLIVCEANAYQETLLFWFNHVCFELGIEGFEFVPIFSGTGQKNSRITNSLKSLMAMEWWLGPDFRVPYIFQVRNWNPMKTNNIDELLDIAAYMPKVLEMYAGLMMTYQSVSYTRANEAKVIQNNCAF